MARAYYIEKELSKDQILELYLNLIFMGNTSYGVEVGSNYYFSKSAKDLDLAECAFLAGINNSPNSYDPFVEDEEQKEKNLAKIKKRTKTVIEKMHELGKINSEEEYKQALEKVENGLTFQKGASLANVYSYHTDAAILQIEKQIMEECKPDEKVMSPGMKYRHYAPNTKCLLVYSSDNEKLINKINEEIELEKNVLVLGRTSNLEKYKTKNKLDMGETLEEISQNIFTLLRKVDSYNVNLVIIEGVEKKGLGLAIMNRLIRACEHNYIEI